MPINYDLEYPKLQRKFFAAQRHARELEAKLKAVSGLVPKLISVMRVPNAEWIADDHNTALGELKALLKEVNNE